MNIIYESEDELYHYRTKGSKNGIRLYQNKDGSLTPLGRIHYKVFGRKKNGEEDIPKQGKPKSTTDESANPKPKQEAPKQESQSEPKPAASEPKRDTTAEDSRNRRRKKLSEMTDDEIRAETNRLRLESDYMTAIAKVTPKKEHTVRKLISEISTEATKNIGTQLATYALGATVNGVAKTIGYTNAQKPAKDKDGKPIYEKDGTQRMINIFEEIVDPRKGQKGGGGGK